MTQTTGSSAARYARRAPLALVFIIILLSLAAAGCATDGHKPVTGRDAAPKVYEPGDWGMKIISVNLTASEHMLDLRYEVTDPEKAAEILNPKTKAYLLQNKTGYVFEVPSMPKAGRLQATRSKPVVGSVYFMLFSTQGMVMPGDEVSLIINDVRFDGLKVN